MRQVVVQQRPKTYKHTLEEAQRKSLGLSKEEAVWWSHGFETVRALRVCPGCTTHAVLAEQPPLPTQRGGEDPRVKG
jgi:hypothetical protein